MSQTTKAEKPEIIETQVLQFTIRNKGEWAEVKINIAETHSTISINGTLGASSYTFGRFGSDFYQFLMGCDRQYLCNKLGFKYWILCQKNTIAKWKEDLFSERRSGQIDAKDARVIYEAIETIRRENFSAHGLLGMYSYYPYEMQMVQNIYGGDMPPEEHKINPDVERFWETIWVPLMWYFVEKGYAKPKAQ